MYLHEAMKQPDREQLLKAMDEEIEVHHKGKHWKLVPRSKIPKDKLILPAVWTMKCKQHINTREIYKWKVQLTIDGSHQHYGLHYWETYASVVTWPAIQFYLTLTLLKGWYT
jgi:hypothetical protein